MGIEAHYLNTVHIGMAEQPELSFWMCGRKGRERNGREGGMHLGLLHLSIRLCRGGPWSTASAHLCHTLLHRGQAVQQVLYQIPWVVGRLQALSQHTSAA